MRANCGGTFSPYGAGNVGATLMGWSTGGPMTAAGQWVPLATNMTTVNAMAPWLPAPPAALLNWSSTSAAQVAMDYIEARVRYLAP